MSVENPHTRPPSLGAYWEYSVKGPACNRVSIVAGNLERKPQYRFTFEAVLQKCSQMDLPGQVEKFIESTSNRMLLPATVLLDEEHVQRIRDDLASWRKWVEWEFARFTMEAISRRMTGKA